MFRQQAGLAEMFKMRCSESTALSLISTFDGAHCGIYGYDQVITEMKFENGLLEYQIEPANTEIPTAKRVNFDEFYFQLISQSGKQKSAGLKRRSTTQSRLPSAPQLAECAPNPDHAESNDGVFIRLRRVGLDACRRVNLRWSERQQLHLDQTRDQSNLPTASSHCSGFRRFFTSNTQAINPDRTVGRLGQLHFLLVNAIKRCAGLAVDLLHALIREF
jgi:hypothetical protein